MERSDTENGTVTEVSWNEVTQKMAVTEVRWKEVAQKMAQSLK
jgi:hypothetical protein